MEKSGLRTSCGFTDGCFRHWVLLLLPSYTGWSLLFLALASLIYLPKEPASAAVRAPSALDVPADWLEAFQSLVNSAYHSVFTFLVRVERIYSDSWLSSSLAARSSGSPTPYLGTICTSRSTHGRTVDGMVTDRFYLRSDGASLRTLFDCMHAMQTSLLHVKYFRSNF